ncbi:uncharacterized protein LOC116178291 [Photinus pyralis]|uniref:uncharacterized protein LOC116178291 n=1 Tax=Photinus pyralis TaxID=7054 RepID=UPI00126732F6|nr:uncharacterized protein LOC116178291 [Photinus pyralis]
MRTLAETERSTLPRGWVRQAVMGVLRWKELPPGRTDYSKTATLQPTTQRHNDKDNNKDDRLSNNNIKISPIATPSQQTPPASPQQAIASKRLLQDTLARSSPYPMIVIPDKGYWIDGTDHECHYDHRGQPVIPHGTWRAKIETDDTAKCYRRFFVGRYSVWQSAKHSFFHQVVFTLS